MLYGVKGAAELNADLIISSGNETYACSFDPSKIDRSSDVSYEEQEIWQIVLYRETIQEDGTAITQTLYPNGSQAFRFSPAKINEYNFRYRL